MWWILIVGVVAVAAWFFFRTNKPERSQPPEKTLKELVAAPEVEAPPVTPSRSADAEPSQADSITIGKNLPLPLTLSGLSAADAKRLAKGLESNDWSTRGWLTLLVARNNVRCEEIDAWVAGARPKLEMAIKKGVAASAEWATASELDRADILEEITGHLVNLGVCVRRSSRGEEERGTIGRYQRTIVRLRGVYDVAHIADAHPRGRCHQRFSVPTFGNALVGGIVERFGILEVARALVLLVGHQGLVPPAVQLQGETQEELEVGSLRCHRSGFLEEGKRLVAMRTVQLVQAHPDVQLRIIGCDGKRLLIVRFRMHERGATLLLCALGTLQEVLHTLDGRGVLCVQQTG